MKLILIILLTMSLGFSKEPVKTKSILLTSDDTIQLADEFNDTSVSIVMKEALDLHNKLPPYKELNFVINSPGGSIISGLKLISFLNSLDRPINMICTFCASMAFQTYQNVKGNRYIINHGTLMSHKATGGFSGQFPGQLTNLLNYWLLKLERLDNEVVSRTNGKHTLASYQALYANDYWCDDNNCISQGFADSIVEVKCGTGFTGLTSRNIQGMFGTYEVFISKCPTIDGIIKYRALDFEGDPVGPFMTPTGYMSSLREVWLKKSIRNINQINFSLSE